MSTSWFFDGNFSGVPDDFFDEAMKCLDFPLEPVEPDDEGEDWKQGFEHLELPPPSLLASFVTGICNTYGNDASTAIKSSSNSDVHHIEAHQFEQYAHTGEDSTSNILPQCDCSEGKYVRLSFTLSPVSVLESSSSSSATENLMLYFPNLAIPEMAKRPRSKRLRLQRCGFTLICPQVTSNSCHSFDAPESEIHKKLLNFSKKKQKRKNLLLLSGTESAVGSVAQQMPSGSRKCTHCEITKTPQWREGPLGPKTLCNACGVRYRSGRLLPEYRPAASPTFVPTVHSNSHRKVLEMRKKADQEIDMLIMDTTPNPIVTECF